MGTFAQHYTKNLFVFNQNGLKLNPHEDIKDTKAEEKPLSDFRALRQYV